MRKITFIASLLAFSGAVAQDFPDPYCELIIYEEIEKITSVEFAGQIVTNSGSSDELIDNTSTIFELQQGSLINPIILRGDTVGNFLNHFTVYIDWDQNGTLDDSDEVYYIGTIQNSEGADDDDISATGNIEVPEGAAIGTTRMRVIKQYLEPNSDPCEIDTTTFESYGQGQDFTVNVSSLSVGSFNKNSFALYPNPTKGLLNVKSDLQIEEASVYNLQGQLVLNSKNQSQLNVSSLATGQYLIKVTSNGTSHTSKFIKE